MDSWRLWKRKEKTTPSREAANSSYSLSLACAVSSVILASPPPRQFWSNNGAICQAGSAKARAVDRLFFLCLASLFCFVFLADEEKQPHTSALLVKSLAARLSLSGLLANWETFGLKFSLAVAARWLACSPGLPSCAASKVSAAERRTETRAGENTQCSVDC